MVTRQASRIFRFPTQILSSTKSPGVNPGDDMVDNTKPGHAAHIVLDEILLLEKASTNCMDHGAKTRIKQSGMQYTAHMLGDKLWTFPLTRIECWKCRFSSHAYMIESPEGIPHAYCHRCGEDTMHRVTDDTSTTPDEAMRLITEYYRNMGLI
ncbi:hypothetical protein CENSYa_0573 [Cenarchaeum symbiosum A]|uniref:Uncharacterized protein n=1 Tax=Cenarchaeum symbiosum (strain A) TaxID=414004 RepID=A0RV39_CENSY|nr:hypothetical protein CENSYa_0573 [Cenarchaeum symbiosum A]